MQQTPKTTNVADVATAGLSDNQKLAIKLGLMVATTVVSSVASAIANKAIERRLNAE